MILKLGIGLVTRLTARWSCSTMLLRYFTCLAMIGATPVLLISSMAAPVGAALVHRDLLGNTAGLHGFVKKAQGCGFVALSRQQKVDRFPSLSTAR